MLATPDHNKGHDHAPIGGGGKVSWDKLSPDEKRDRELEIRPRELDNVFGKALASAIEMICFAPGQISKMRFKSDDYE